MTGFNGNVLLGTGHMFEQFYIGAEINGEWSTADYVNKEGAAKKTYDKTYGYGISLMPGIVHGNTLFYLKGGVGRDRFEIKSSGVTSAKKNKTQLYWSLGGGIEALVTEQIALRAEYIHKWHNDFKGTAVEVESNGSKNYKWDPSSDQFNVGVIFKFM